MNYDKSFFEMIKLRGEELYPVSLPYAWYSVNTAAGIVLMNKEHNFEQMEWWLSWVRNDAPDSFTIEAMASCICWQRILFLWTYNNPLS